MFAEWREDRFHCPWYESFPSSASNRNSYIDDALISAAKYNMYFGGPRP